MLNTWLLLAAAEAADVMLVVVVREAYLLAT
jgi:hypothetical protein